MISEWIEEMWRDDVEADMGALGLRPMRESTFYERLLLAHLRRDLCKLDERDSVLRETERRHTAVQKSCNIELSKRRAVQQQLDDAEAWLCYAQSVPPPIEPRLR